MTLFDELREHFSEPEIMALGWRMAIFIGYGRLVFAVGLEGVGKLCPLSFAHDGNAGAGQNIRNLRISPIGDEDRY